MQQTDEQLVTSFLSGEEKALEILVDKYLKSLYNFVYQMVRDKEVAEDITQDVFVKMWKKMSAFDSRWKFRTWLYTIAKNTAYDFLKKKKAIPFVAFEKEDGANILEFIEDKDALYSENFLKVMDDKKDAQDFLNNVSPQIKTLLILHHNQGFSLVEIAQIMGHSPNTIKSKYHRAILELRRQISSKNALFKVKIS
jgi:RNA polymerase sigma-70 factor, ECF subfamily